jgi:hypothetical protein
MSQKCAKITGLAPECDVSAVHRTLDELSAAFRDDFSNAYRIAQEIGEPLTWSVVIGRIGLAACGRASHLRVFDVASAEAEAEHGLGCLNAARDILDVVEHEPSRLQAMVHLSLGYSLLGRRRDARMLVCTVEERAKKAGLTSMVRRSEEQLRHLDEQEQIQALLDQGIVRSPKYRV